MLDVLDADDEGGIDQDNYYRNINYNSKTYLKTKYLFKVKYEMFFFDKIKASIFFTPDYWSL